MTTTDHINKLRLIAASVIDAAEPVFKANGISPGEEAAIYHILSAMVIVKNRKPNVTAKESLDKSLSFITDEASKMQMYEMLLNPSAPIEEPFLYAFCQDDSIPS
jgi:hypothetical protein